MKNRHEENSAVHKQTNKTSEKMSSTKGVISGRLSKKKMLQENCNVLKGEKQQKANEHNIIN